MILLLLLQFVFGNVITANHKNFQEIVLKSNHVVMVEFFAPWCGHCKNLAPEYAKAASKLKGLAKLVAVDCDNSVNRELCSRYGVQGFPTLKIFSAGKKGLATDYNGERTAKAIVDTITPMIPGRYVTKIGGTAKKAVTLEQFQNDKSLAQVVLVTDKKTTPTLFKALSIEYLDRLFFGEVKSSSKDIVETLGISSFPTILVFTKEGEKVVYDGPIKQEKVVAFLEQYAGPPLVKSKPSKVKPKKEKEPKKEQRAPFDPTISEITSQNGFQDLCLSKDLCIVSFITHEPDYPESTKAKDDSVSVLNAVKKHYYEKTKNYDFVWMNPLERGQKLIRDFGISDGYPSMIVFSPAKKQYKLLRSAFDEKAIIQFLDSAGGYLKYTLEPLLDGRDTSDL